MPVGVRSDRPPETQGRVGTAGLPPTPKSHGRAHHGPEFQGISFARGVLMMVGDDFRGLSADDFVRRALLADHPLELKLLEAQAAGLASNLHRQLVFLDVPIVEVQVLGYRRSPTDTYDKTRAAHCTADNVASLCEETDRWVMHGAYVLCAQLAGGVETRYATPGRWFDIPKDGGTKESDVLARRILAIDFDVKRPSGTSATNEELARSVNVALLAWQYLSGALGGEASMAYVHSGNGRQIHLALDSLPVNKDTGVLLAGLLVGLDTLLSTDEVHVDRKLYDAKRILPACGTLKKKGAPDIETRPHRRTAIVTPAQAHRLTAEELLELARKVWNDTDDEGRSAMNAALGVKQIVQPFNAPKDTPFGRVNAVPPRDVAEWLGGIVDGKRTVCPGCGESSGVAILNRGLKCHHNRCADRGRQGFRSNVDLVAEVRNVAPKEAVALIAERFGLPILVHSVAEPSAPISTPSFPSPDRITWISTEGIFEPLPPTRWLVPSLHLVAGRPTLLAGYGASGKTLMVQSLALALAACVPVWGSFSPNDSTQVRHLDYEQGKHATLKRYQRLCIGHGIAREQLGDRLQVAIFPEVYLDDRDATEVYARVCDGIGVVVLDALRGATPTLDENDSTIRKCLDNLSRVSEKTGTAFVVLHHAGKNQGDDPRTLARGSSAIFDASGCVLNVTGEANEPKEVRQVKQPAEAEGAQLAPFFVVVEDVQANGSPTGGVRVVVPNAQQAKTKVGASAKFLALKEAIWGLVQASPGLRTKNSICDRVAGGNKSAKCTAIDELVQDGRIYNSDTGFIAVGNSPETLGPASSSGAAVVPAVPRGPSVVPSGPERSKQSSQDRSHVVPPLQGDRGTGTATQHLTGPKAAEERRRSESQIDADLLATMPAKERTQYAAAQGWSDGRSKRARGALALRESSIRRDAMALQKAADGGLDAAAWATEQGWSDERIAAAKLRMEV